MSPFLRNAVVLGLLSAVGPFAIDMYLPALPAIGLDLGADTAAVQASLMVFMFAVAICQLIYGPLADMFGRRAPIYFGLALFSAASVGCALASDIYFLIGFRFIQGIGACAVMVIPRAVVRDLHTGVEATRLMSTIMLVFSVSPILAPLVGSVFSETLGWRAIFWVVGAAGLIGLVLTALVLPETRPAEMRLESSFGSAFAGYRKLLVDPNFLGLSFIAGFGMASFMSYLANSSFVLIGHYGLTPSLYSLAFSINAVAFIGMSQLNGMLTGRFGLRRVVRFAVAGYALFMVTLLALTVSGVDRLEVMMVMLFVGYGFLGLVLPTTMVLAMEDYGEIAGTASALMGTLQFLTAVAMMGVVGLFFDGTSLPMVTGIAVSAAIAFTIAQATLGRRRRELAEPAE